MFFSFIGNASKLYLSCCGLFPCVSRLSLSAASSLALRESAAACAGEHLVHLHAGLVVDAVRVLFGALARFNGVSLGAAGDFVVLHQLLRLLLGVENDLFGAGVRVRQ